MRAPLLAAALLAAAPPALGQGAADEDGRRMLTDAEAPAFRAVGRLNIAGTRFCTATLIAADIVATAAHCLFHPRTREEVPPEEMRFVAGLRRGEVAALRDVTATALADGFVLAESLDLAGVRGDLALVRLDVPVAPGEAEPLPTGGLLAAGDAVTIVSYARDRAQAASIQEGCAVDAVLAGIATLHCPVTFGASGAPVFGPDGRLAGIVSAIGTLSDGEDVTFAVLLASHLESLEAALGP